MIIKNIKGLDQFFTQTAPLTNVNGEFSCTLEGDYGSSSIYKEGYVSKKSYLDIENGKMNDELIQLVPRDGFLRLKIENSTGEHDTVYVTIYSKMLAKEENTFYYNGQLIKAYPLVLNQGETYTEILPLPSPEFVGIRLGFNKKLLTEKDSVLINPKDTTMYLLSY